MRRRFSTSLAAAVAVAALAFIPLYGQVPQGQNGNGAAMPTPRTPDGHPDFSGVWNGGGGGGGGNQGAVDEKGNVTVTFASRDGSVYNFERDSGLRTRMDPNKPIYKPEYWDKVSELDINGNAEDPTFSCMPAGVPRMGPPTKIVQTPTEMIFLHQNRNTFRVIPIDGRPHAPENTLEGTWTGDAVGRWEGDTLVIDTIGITEESWLDFPGYFHSPKMHVVERMKREGNTVTWNATVEDPVVLLKPWVMNQRTLRLNADPKAALAEDLPCSERDLLHLVTKERG